MWTGQDKAARQRQHSVDAPEIFHAAVDIGAHLNEMLGARYAVIGSGLAVSEANGIGQLELGTLEALLTRLGEPGVLIPTHKGKGLPASEIAALPTRSGSVKNSTYFALTPAAFTDFDWLAILASSTYSRGGPPLP